MSRRPYREAERHELERAIIDRNERIVDESGEPKKGKRKQVKGQGLKRNQQLEHPNR